MVGSVRGTASPDQYIVVTAHYDHVGIGRPVDGDSIYNGADDNASGTAALVALAKWFVANPPRHTIVFAAVDGEERGMGGSRHFVNAPTVPLEQILLNINMDMIGRNVKNELYAAGPGKYPQLRPTVEAVIRCAPLTLLIGHDTPAAGPGNDWTAQSDQASFHAKGIPFIYFGEEDHPDYHKPSDHVERADAGLLCQRGTGGGRSHPPIRREPGRAVAGRNARPAATARRSPSRSASTPFTITAATPVAYWKGCSNVA